MENPRLLDKFKVRNVSEADIDFQITTDFGEVHTQTLQAGEVVEGVTYHGIRFLEPWIGSLEIRREDEEFEGYAFITHDWLKEGF